MRDSWIRGASIGRTICYVDVEKQAQHSTYPGMGMGTGSDRSTRQARPRYTVAWGSVQWLSAAAAPASFGGEAANPGAGAAGGRWNLCNLVLM